MIPDSFQQWVFGRVLLPLYFLSLKFKTQISKGKNFLTYFQEMLTNLGIPCYSQNPYPTMGVQFTSVLLSNIA